MAYNYSDIRLAVQDDLKDPSFSITRIGRYVNAGQNAIFNTHMFKFCEQLTTKTLMIGDSTITQPVDHQATIGGSLYDAASKKRFKLDADTLVDSRDFFDWYPGYATNTQGLPNRWTEYGTAIYLTNPLDKAYVFTQRYYRMPTELINDEDTPDVPASFRELLEMYALYRSEKYRGRHDIAATYLQGFEDGLEAMVLRYAEGTQVGPVVQGSSRVRVSEDA